MLRRNFTLLNTISSLPCASRSNRLLKNPSETTNALYGTTALLGGQIYATNPATGATVLDPGPKTIVADNSAFFCVNYGAGIKVTKLWGPMGARVDVRGRTFPNLRGQTVTWPEATAGLLFTFGEK